MALPAVPASSTSVRSLASSGVAAAQELAAQELASTAEDDDAQEESTDDSAFEASHEELESCEVNGGDSVDLVAFWDTAPGTEYTYESRGPGGAQVGGFRLCAEHAASEDSVVL